MLVRLAGLLLLTCSVHAAPLRVGTASVEITPSLSGPPVWLAGYGVGRQAAGVQDKLFARAVAFESGGKKLAVVVLDLIGFFMEDVEAVRRRVQGTVDGCVVASTHTHAGPDTMGLWGPNFYTSGQNRVYNELVVAKAALAVREAVASLRPATLTLAVTATPGLQRDSRLPRVVDERLHALEAVGEKGEPIVTVIHWSAHPTALDGKNKLVSADYAGYLIERVRSRRGGPAVFWNGAIGGQISVAEADKDGRQAAPRTFEHARAIGEAVADAACAALAKDAKPLAAEPLELRTAPVFVPLANALYRTGIGLGAVPRKLYRDGKEQTGAGAVLSGTHIRSEVGLLTIGELHAGMVPGELYPELLDAKGLETVDPGADFQDAKPEPALLPLLGGKHRIVLGLANDEIGYLIPRSRWDVNPPFCFGLPKAQYGERNSCGPGAAAAIAEAFQKLSAGP